jgi:hypothetical protein
MLSFFKRPESRIILAVIWGFGLAAIFRKSCEGRKCVVIKTPAIKDLDDHQFQYENDEKCYSYKPVFVSCSEDSEKKIKEVLKEETFKSPMYQ